MRIILAINYAFGVAQRGRLPRPDEEDEPLEPPRKPTLNSPNELTIRVGRAQSIVKAGGTRCRHTTS